MNILDLFNKPLISEKQPINAIDLFNKPISNEFNNNDKLKSPIKIIGLNVPSKLNTQLKTNVTEPNEQQTPVKVNRVQVPKLEPKSDNCQVSKPIKINVMKPNEQDKCVIKQQTPIKVIRVQVPKS
jgi:hypothetical protein